MKLNQLVRGGRVAAAAGALFVAAGIGTAACGGSSVPARPTASDTIVIRNFGFEPADLTVPQGARVTVRNEDGAAHTITADDGTFNTGNIGPGRRVTLKATAPGRHPYHCDIHQFMHGVLVVGK